MPDDITLADLFAPDPNRPIVTTPFAEPGKMWGDMGSAAEGEIDETPVVNLPPIPDQVVREVRSLIMEKAKRKVEGLKLYEPMQWQHMFHASRAKVRIIRGSNRAGKTLSACVELARAVTGQDPYDKYPKRDGVAYIVGKDGREVGQVVWKKLYRAQAFKILRDPITGIWRAFRPWEPADAALASSARWAPPLIPMRMIKDIAWENKKEGLPKLVKLVNGWELHFFSSLGKPPHGADIDFCHFDEEIIDRDWYPEMAARLVDRSGHFVWSATPQAGTEQLYDLHEEAERQEKLPEDERTCQEFVSLLDANMHLTQQQKLEFAAKLSEEERQVRIGGEFAFLTFKVFPEFNGVLHECPAFDPPPTWTRYVAIDPGRQICAALFMAIPPADHGDYAYLYDELYLPNCDAVLFGNKMAIKCANQDFEAFIIDHQEGRKHETGSGRTIEDQYAMALASHKVGCRRTGSRFTWGVADPISGTEACRLWLKDRWDEQGQPIGPKLRIMQGKCTNFIEEIKKYRYKRVQNITTDEPESRGRVHSMACLRYLVQANPRFVEPPPKVRETGLIKALQRKKEKNKAKNGQVVNLGPGA
jgi:hypothetical protein